MRPELQSKDDKVTQQARRHARAVFLGFSAVLAASILLPMPDAQGKIAHLPSLCPFYNLTGLPCPGCGLTRAFVCLGHGQLWVSLHWHPLGWLAYAVCIAFWLRAGVSWQRSVTLFPLAPRLGSLLAWSAAALFLISGIVRIVWVIRQHVTF